jgi:hypothetical protein
VSHSFAKKRHNHLTAAADVIGAGAFFGATATMCEAIFAVPAWCWWR